MYTHNKNLKLMCSFSESIELKLIILYLRYRIMYLWSYTTLRLIQAGPYAEPQALKGSALIPSPRTSAQTCATLQSPGTQFQGPHGPLYLTHPLKDRSYHLLITSPKWHLLARRFQCPHCTQGPCRRQKNTKIFPFQSPEPMNTLFYMASEVLETCLH